MNNKPTFGGAGGNTASKRKEVAALWVKQDKNGNEYYSAKVSRNGEEFYLNFFKNRHKDGPKQPDFRAYED